MITHTHTLTNSCAPVMEFACIMIWHIRHGPQQLFGVDLAEGIWWGYWYQRLPWGVKRNHSLLVMRLVMCVASRNQVIGVLVRIVHQEQYLYWVITKDYLCNLSWPVWLTDCISLCFCYYDKIINISSVCLYSSIVCAHALLLIACWLVFVVLLFVE